MINCIKENKSNRIQLRGIDLLETYHQVGSFELIEDICYLIFFPDGMLFMPELIKYVYTLLCTFYIY